jgi:hypothetical protein
MSDETATTDTAPAAPAGRPKLPSIGQLFKESWELYRRRVLTLFGVLLRALLGVFLLVLAIVAATALLFFVLKEHRGLAIFVIWPVSIFCLVRLIFKYTLAMIYAAEGEARTTAESLSLAQPDVWSFAGTHVLAAMLVIGSAIGSLFFFCILGLVMSIWAFFTSYAFACEGKKGMDAFMRSKALVRGNWWGVFGRILLFNILMLLINMVPIVGQIVCLGLLPYGLVYNLALYRQLAALKGPEAPAGSKKAVLIFGLSGFIVVPVAIVLFGGVMAGLSKMVPLDNFKPGVKARSSGPNYRPVMPEAEPVIAPNAPRAAKKSRYTHEIIMRNGQRMSVRVVEKDERGVLIELSPGTRTLLTNDEIAQITELKNENGGTE